MPTAAGGSCLMLVCLEIGRGMACKRQGTCSRKTMLPVALCQPELRELGLKSRLHKLGS